MTRVVRRIPEQRFTLVIALVSLTLLGPGSTASASSAIEAVDEQVENTIAEPSAESPDATVNDFLDLERSLTECISSNPPPGCGRVPTSPGDRGGWQQLVLFGVMMSGIAIIFWRVSRAVRRRDTTTITE